MIEIPKVQSSSVVYFDLTIKVKEKKQAEYIIRKILDSRIDYNFRYEASFTENMFIIHIEDCCWGQNIIDIGEWIKEMEPIV